MKFLAYFIEINRQNDLENIFIIQALELSRMSFPVRQINFMIHQKIENIIYTLHKNVYEDELL